MDNVMAFWQSPHVGRHCMPAAECSSIPMRNQIICDPKTVKMQCVDKHTSVIPRGAAETIGPLRSTGLELFIEQKRMQKQCVSNGLS